MYKNILFDWDGCVVRTLDVWIEVCREALLRQSIQTTDEEIWQAMCCSGVATRMEVPDKQALKDDVTTLLLARQNIELHNGVSDFLKRHHAYKTMAIVSNTRSQMLKRTLQQHKLEPYFKAIIDDTAGVKPKPDPEGIRRAMDLIGATPEETVFVGDSGADIMAAHNAGVTSVLFFPEDHRRLCGQKHLLDHRPSHVVKDFLELSMLIV